jgi:hypothetical protein
MIGRQWTAVLTVAMAACGGRVVLDGATGATGAGTAQNPIVGMWEVSVIEGVVTEEQTLTFSGDGMLDTTITFVEDGSASPGSIDITATWTSTATTISLAHETCMGQSECASGGPGEDA